MDYWLTSQMTKGILPTTAAQSLGCADIGIKFKNGWKIFLKFLFIMFNIWQRNKSLKISLCLEPVFVSKDRIDYWWLKKLEENFFWGSWKTKMFFELSLKTKRRRVLFQILGNGASGSEFLWNNVCFDFDDGLVL